MEWTNTYSDRLMISYETTHHGHFIAEIFYGNLGGMGKPTGASIRLFDFQGPVVFETSPLENIDALKKVLEENLRRLQQEFSRWNLSSAGDGNRFLISQVFEDKMLVYRIDRKSSNEIRPFWTDATEDSLWHNKFKVYGKLSPCKVSEFLDGYSTFPHPDPDCEVTTSYFG